MSTDPYQVQPWVPGTSGLSLRQLIRALWSRKWVVVLTTAVMLGLAVLYTVMATPTYSATATLLINYQANDPGRAADFPSMLETGFFNTQTKLLGSRRVMVQALRRVGLTDDPQARAEFEELAGGRGSFEDWLASHMLEQVAIAADPEDRIVDVTVEADDPQLAADLANAIVESYLRSALELARSPAIGQTDRFEGQLGEKRQQVEQAQQDLTEYQQEAQIVDIGERVSTEQERLSELTRAMTEAQTRRQELEARLNLMQRMRASGQAAENLADALDNPLIQNLKDRLSELRTRRAEQSRVLGANHPRYRQLSAEIQTVAAQLEAEIAEAIETLRGEVRLARQQENSLTARMRQQRQTVLDLERKRDKQAVLKRDLAAAEQRYLAASERLDRVEVTADQSMPSASFVARATVPVSQESPNLKLNVVAGTLLGGILGCCLALLLELFFRRVRSVEDIERELGIPVLAEVG